MSNTLSEYTTNELKKELFKRRKTNYDKSIKNVIETTCKYFDVKKKDVLSRKIGSRKGDLVKARDYIIYILRYKMKFSCENVAKEINRKHPAVSIQSTKIKNQINIYPSVKNEIDEIYELITLKQ